MSFLKLISPVRAVRDLRQFLATRKRYEWLMLIPALLGTLYVIFAFYKDSHFERAYEREIIYVESWPLTRSESEIRAQQVLDRAAKEKREAELEAKAKARQQDFQKLDNSLKAWGI
ncbi:MAG: hypothetical protein V4574_07685 [Pseudomonadota bacterium]